MWSASEGHLYREQRRLVKMGWVSVENEPVGKRTRKRYTITPSGRAALTEWLASDPDEPHFEIEGILRLFYADHGTVEDLRSSAESTARAAREMMSEMVEIAEDYLAEGGPLTMLESGVGGPGEPRIEYKSRPQFPERLHAVSLALDITTRLLATVDEFFTATSEETLSWSTTADSELTPATRRRLEEIVGRHSTDREAATD